MYLPVLYKFIFIYLYTIHLCYELLSSETLTCEQMLFVMSYYYEFIDL